MESMGSPASCPPCWPASLQGTAVTEARYRFGGFCSESGCRESISGDMAAA